MREDTGFAPNPFGGYCTLACCKAEIRKRANIGDWVIGTTPAPDVGKVIYAMEITETRLYGGYFEDPEFQHKKPSPDNIYGDNIYKETSPGIYQQIGNYFHDASDCTSDLSSGRVLISSNFYYFGDKAPQIPEECLELVHSTQGYLIRDSGGQVAESFFKWLEQFSPGLNGQPRNQTYDLRTS